MDDVSEAIEEMTEYHRNNMPSEIKTAISRLNADLYHGPLYFDAEGEPCSCFDDGATAFKFSENGTKVRNWIDENVNDVQVEVGFNEETEESFYESVDGSARAIARSLLGKELNSTI